MFKLKKIIIVIMIIMVYRYEDATYMMMHILFLTILSLAEIVRISVLVTALVNNKLKHIFLSSYSFT